ncbi:MAG: hypothetical protein ACPG5T_10940 [Endozoicomonas sp.]
MDRTIHPTSAEQTSVGCIDNGAHLKGGDIALNDIDSGFNGVIVHGLAL